MTRVDAPQRPAVRVWRPEGTDGIVCMAGTTASYAIDPYDEYVIGTVERGGFRATRDGRTYDVGTRQLVRWDPSGAHRGRPSGHEPWEARLAIVDLPAMRRWLLDEEDDGGPIAFDRPVLDDPATAALFRGLHRRLELPAPRLERDAQLLLVFRAVAGGGAAPDGRARRYAEPAVTTAREYLEAHLARNVSLDELAAACGMGRFRLVRAFTAQVGVPPHRFHLGRRLGAARRMLEAGEAPGAAALATGFSDQSHLHRHFRRAVGATPGAYRRAFAAR